jgi:hypothetical protein
MSTQSEPGDGRLDPSLSAIVSERLQLINLAYRLLGSLADAEDVAQGTYARWYAMFQQQEEAIASQPAADEGGKSHLPRCARFGAGLAVELLGMHLPSRCRIVRNPTCARIGRRDPSSG